MHTPLGPTTLGLSAPNSRRLLLSLTIALLSGTAAQAAGPSADSLYPRETVGFVSIQNVPDFRARWNRMQIGKLASDPAMKPFVDSLRDQFNRRVGRLDEKLGVTIDDLNDVASGEAAIGFIGIADGREKASVAVVLDVTKNDKQARELIAKIEAEMERRGASTAGDIDQGDVKTYTIPPGEDEYGEPTAEQTASIFLYRDRLGASDNADVARGILARMKGGEALKDAEGYKATMRKSAAEADGLKPNVKWFVSPFEYDLAATTLEDARMIPDKEDTFTMLREQGFDAVKGVGGQISLAVDSLRDLVHHTVIHAPPKEGAEGKPAAEKYDLAMRMFELPNATSELTIEDWTPREVASYKTASVNIQNVFDHLGSLFDAIAGYENAFETTLEGFEKDPFGPKINLRDEVVEHLGSRVTLMTDYTTPITEDCERYLIVVDVTDEGSLREPLDKLLESDGAERKEIQGVAYWEIVPEEEALAMDDLDGGLLPMDDGFGAFEDMEIEEEERVLQRAAVCLHEGKLAIGSDVDFLSQALFGIDERDALPRSPDLKAAIDTLKGQAPSERCAWSFTRTDESLRPTYELLRQGKMPQSQTFFGRLLNKLLITDDEAEAGANRQQKIDGGDLPSFELARRYFGPAARAVRSDDDGWLIVGILLSKAAE